MPIPNEMHPTNPDGSPRPELNPGVEGVVVNRSAIVHPTARLFDHVRIEAYANIGNRVSIEPRSVVGKSCYLHPLVRLCSGTKLGPAVRVGADAIVAGTIGGYTNIPGGVCITDERAVISDRNHVLYLAGGFGVSEVAITAYRIRDPRQYAEVDMRVKAGCQLITLAEMEANVEDLGTFEGYTWEAHGKAETLRFQKEYLALCELLKLRLDTWRAEALADGIH